MALRLPGGLILTASLVAIGFTGGGASLAIQRWQSQQNAARFAHEMTGGDAAVGKLAFARRRCGACHAIGNVQNAVGVTGPALDGVGSRAFLAGAQPNDPPHMIAWIQHPQAVRPGSGMPELGIGDQEARDLASYLYTLR